MEILIALMAGLIIDLLQIRKWYQVRKQTKNLIKNKSSFHYLNTNMVNYILHIVVLIVSLFFAFYFEDNYKRATFIFVGFIAINSLTVIYTYKTIYYDKKGFILNGIYYRYTDIKKIQNSNNPFSVKIETKTNDIVKTSKKIGEFIKTKLGK